LNLLFVAALVPGGAVADDKSAPRRASESTPATVTPFVVAGYLPWYRTRGFTAERMQGVTDLIYFELKPPPDGELGANPIDGKTLELLRTLKKSTGCRLLLCVGGGDRSDGFAELAADPRARQRFIDGLLAYCRRHGFDGVDFDWEFPTGNQLSDHAELLIRTKQAFAKDGLLVTVAISPWRDIGRRAYAAVDRAHVMSYTHRFPQARFSDAEADVARMLQFGCPREKIVLGVPFFGRDREGRSKTYAELVANGALAAATDESEGYAFNGRATIRAKARYAAEERLGGMMIWELGQDSNQRGASLLEALTSELRDRK
jgi:GH18 family chitinase